jgi:hypothetical protein|tara:strand:+ start:495 stop:626 length:132 start_codon:yes stop_codon:yes gene_type:complete
MGKDFTTKGTGKGKMPQGGESNKQERKNLIKDNPVAKKASAKY